MYDADDRSLTAFEQTLSENSLDLRREKVSILQVNTGLLCNQVCKHCHLNAGPARTELMDRKTVDDIAAFARQYRFDMIDITGGAPEMNSELPRMIHIFKELAPVVVIRCNLTALHENDSLIPLFAETGVTVTASFPSLNEKQADAQRGDGIFQESITVLKRLNNEGYGIGGTGLELNLVSNPSGAFMPTSQKQAEDRFRKVLMSKWGIRFNNLYSFANVPLGRFKSWLKSSGNYDAYIAKLAGNFNPEAVSGLMCRSLISVDWNGYLYDCDFNLAAGIPSGGKKTHIAELSGPPEEGTPIAMADHCYACTAGAGFT